MIRIVCAIAAAAFIFAAGFATSQAAPMAPLPAGVATADHGNVTHVWYYHRHRHCWRGRWGRLHCAW